MAGSWNVPKRTKDGETRQTTAPGSNLASPLHEQTRNVKGCAQSYSDDMLPGALRFLTISAAE